MTTPTVQEIREAFELGSKSIWEVLLSAVDAARAEGYAKAREQAAVGMSNALARWHRIKNTPEMKGVTLAKFLTDDIRAMQDERGAEVEERHSNVCAWFVGGPCSRACRARGVEDMP